MSNPKPAPPPPAKPSPPPGPGPGVPPAEIDAGFRLPLWGLCGGAVMWMVIGMFLAFLASMKMHAPGALADVAWLTYGRLRPAATSVLLYGFATQAAFGLSLWLLARLGRTRLFGSITVTIAAKVWNFGVLVGLLGILAGGATGFERFEMPGYALGILFASGLLIGICALLTFHHRQPRELYPSQWYVVASLIWFPWLLSTGWLLLVVWPVRGAVQMAVQTWVATGLFQFWLVPLGVAALLYFVPLFCGRPLHSRYLAMFAFWNQALFAGWTGLHGGAPLPAWMVGMSVVCGVLLLMPVLATGLNLWETWRGAKRDASPASQFFLFGAVCYLASGLLGVLNAIPSFNRQLQFTLFGLGLEQLILLGFFGSVALGFLYHVGPLVAGLPWPSAKLARNHFWLHAAGITLAGVALIVGGLVQGAAWNDPNIQPLDVSRKTLPFIGTATMGTLAMLAGSLCLAWNGGQLIYLRCRSACQPWLASATAPIEPAGVKA